MVKCIDMINSMYWYVKTTTPSMNNIVHIYWMAGEINETQIKINVNEYDDTVISFLYFMPTRICIKLILTTKKSPSAIDWHNKCKECPGIVQDLYLLKMSTFINV